MIFIIPYIFLTLTGLLSAIKVAAAPLQVLSSQKHVRAPHVDAFLFGHNVVRATHGADPLTWSSSLAEKAEQWANGCQFKHSDGTLSSTPYGENIVAGAGEFPIHAAVDLFTQDASQYNPASPTYNHFTQVVWKSTTQLGCAIAQCDGIFDPKFGKATYYVCLYNPVGNVVGDALLNVQI